MGRTLDLFVKSAWWMFLLSLQRSLEPVPGLFQWTIFSVSRIGSAGLVGSPREQKVEPGDNNSLLAKYKRHKNLNHTLCCPSVDMRSQRTGTRFKEKTQLAVVCPLWNVCSGSLRGDTHSCWRRLRLCCVPETGSDSANPGSPHSGWPPMTTCTISSPAKTAPTTQWYIEQGSTVFLVLCSSCPSTSLSSFSTTSICVHSLTQQTYTNISENFCVVPFVICVDSLSEYWNKAQSSVFTLSEVRPPAWPPSAILSGLSWQSISLLLQS